MLCIYEILIVFRSLRNRRFCALCDYRTAFIDHTIYTACEEVEEDKDRDIDDVYGYNEYRIYRRRAERDLNKTGEGCEGNVVESNVVVEHIEIVDLVATADQIDHYTDNEAGEEVYVEYFKGVLDRRFIYTWESTDGDRHDRHYDNKCMLLDIMYIPERECLG